MLSKFAFVRSPAWWSPYKHSFCSTFGLSKCCFFLESQVLLPQRDVMILYTFSQNSRLYSLFIEFALYARSHSIRVWAFTSFPVLKCYFGRNPKWCSPFKYLFCYLLLLSECWLCKESEMLSMQAFYLQSFRAFEMFLCKESEMLLSMQASVCSNSCSQNATS